MRTTKTKKKIREDDEMKPHYDFKNAVKPRYAERFPDGAIITIKASNGSRQKKVELKSMVILDSDITKVFPNGRAVNAALRHLIAAIPKH